MLSKAGPSSRALPRPGKSTRINVSHARDFCMQKWRQSELSCAISLQLLVIFVLHSAQGYYKIVVGGAAFGLLQGSNMATDTDASGGFLLSPPPSSVASSSVATAVLPQPRHIPLRPGGSKESTLIRYLDQHVLHIQRRFAKRTTPSTSGDPEAAIALPIKADTFSDVEGYASMREACKDVSELVDLVWISGTTRLIVPYLINLALLLQTMVSSMPPAPKALFELLDKLDRAFASLAQGRDVDTDEALPGASGVKALVSGTEKVRIRSIVDRTRTAAFQAFKGDVFDNEAGEVDDDDDDDAENRLETDDEGLVIENPSEVPWAEQDSWDMQLARVYDRTMVELGDTLEEPSIGIVTEKRS
nr:hypothetical protein CFP56_07494 [Quercus suber]